NFIPLGVLSLLALGVLLFIGKLVVDQSRRQADDPRRRAEESEAQNKTNQEAIQRLLDEISEFGNGALRVRARVTEHVTGAIADSINAAIDEMTRLVKGINEASTQVAAATGEAQTVSGRLL